MKRRKDGHVPGEENDADIIALTSSVPPRETPAHASTSIKPSPSKLQNMDVDSATEDESDGELNVPVKKPGVPPSSSNKPKPELVTPPEPQAQLQPEIALPTPARSPASASPPVDPGVALGRIVGNTSPLEDFKRNLQEGDIVTQAVHDLGQVIKEIITRPFASRRHQEMLECLKEMRLVALQACYMVLVYFFL